MAPPAPRPDNDDDLDDLNDVLDDFQSGPQPVAPSKPVPAVPVSAPSTAVEGDDFPDPEDDELDPEDEVDEAEFAKELQNGMAALMSGLDEGDGQEFAKMMQEMLGVSGGEGLLASLGLEGGMPVPAPATGGKAGKGKAKALETSAAPAGNFQDTIKAAMNKMKETSSTIDAETEEKKAAGGDPLAAMMAQMAGLGDLGGEEGLQGMLDEVMEQLMSRELLYEPLKELAAKYPTYLADNATTLSAKDLKRFQAQKLVVEEIVAKFEEPGATSEKKGEPSFVARNAAVVELVAKMNECGAPPKELMGDMPAGMDGEGMPEGCTIC